MPLSRIINIIHLLNLQIFTECLYVPDTWGRGQGKVKNKTDTSLMSKNLSSCGETILTESLNEGYHGVSPQCQGRTLRVTSSSLCLLEGRARCLHGRSWSSKRKRASGKVGSPERETESLRIERSERLAKTFFIV